VKPIRSIAISLVVGFTCAAFAQPTTPPVNVWAWGWNERGQCTVPADLTNALAVAGGGYHTLALMPGGTVRAWGDNGQGQCNVPPDLTNAVAVAFGDIHSLAIRADGKVRAWGDNSQGQCDVPLGLTTVVAVAGSLASFALQSDGTVRAWGYSANGQCNVPSDLEEVVDIACGSGHVVALQRDGTVRAWGYNNDGQCDVPPDLSGVVAVAAGTEHSLALKADGTVRAWGAGRFGQSNVPLDVTNVVAIAAGETHSLALRADGTVRAWGYNGNGQCDVPPDLPFVLAISAGNAHSLALVDPTRAATAPTILMQPKSQTVAIGSSASFAVQANGFPPLKYHWYFGGTALAGETNRYLSLTALQGSQSGAYTVKVSNAAGSTTSQTAMLSVLPSLDVHMVPAVALTGDVGVAYRIEYVNAVGPVGDWQELATITVAIIGQFYFDVSAIGQPVRFYRLVESP
jgi:alpha-tubulin suppressor-like RCC1 family protein